VPAIEPVIFSVSVVEQVGEATPELDLIQAGAFLPAAESVTQAAGATLTSKVMVSASVS
jgi:hypothetical protein